jgi:hypothetical protein
MVNTFKKLNAAIALAFICFVFTSTTLNAATLAEAKEALAIYEARGDTVKAGRIREAIKEVEAQNYADSYERIRQEGLVEIERQRALRERFAAPVEDPSLLDDTAYFFGFGEKAAAERRSEQANQCATSAAEYYREKRYEAAVNPSTWQLDGYESAEDYAGAFRSIFYRRCASR